MCSWMTTQSLKWTTFVLFLFKLFENYKSALCVKMDYNLLKSSLSATFEFCYFLSMLKKRGALPKCLLHALLDLLWPIRGMTAWRQIMTLSIFSDSADLLFFVPEYHKKRLSFCITFRILLVQEHINQPSCKKWGLFNVQLPLYLGISFTFSHVIKHIIYITTITTNPFPLGTLG